MFTVYKLLPYLSSDEAATSPGRSLRYACQSGTPYTPDSYVRRNSNPRIAPQSTVRAIATNDRNASRIVTAARVVVADKTCTSAARWRYTVASESIQYAIDLAVVLTAPDPVLSSALYNRMTPPPSPLLPPPSQQGRNDLSSV